MRRSRALVYWQETDTESNLGFFGVRLYDPTYGRFMSVDPLWKAYASFSPYIYCRNNPISRTDASGLGDEPIVGKPVMEGLLLQRGLPLGRVLGTPTRPGPVTIRAGQAPNATAYNCHSFAWSNGKGDPDDPANKDYVGDFPHWDMSPMNNAAEQADEISFDTPNEAGDRVIYFAEGADGVPEPTHSAVVVSVDECGNTTLVVSKWGESYLLLHHPRDVPPAYGQDNPDAVTSIGIPYHARKYYRMRSKEQEKKNVEQPTEGEP